MKEIIGTLLFLLAIGIPSMAQELITLEGDVVDENKLPLIGATILIKDIGKGTITDLDGHYILEGISPGSYTLEISYTGFTTQEISISLNNVENRIQDITLREDALQLDAIVVTGTFDNRTKLESSVAITSLDANIIEQRNPKSTAELIGVVPGTFVDNSNGEVGGKIYARGLATGIRTQPGYQYVSLQEDGLPVLSTQFQFSIVDMYHRPDITVNKFEAIRGGSASISTANAPGGIFNFISEEGSEQPSARLKVQAGLQGPLNSLFRADFNAGGPVSKKWFYNIGGFYRFDEGARDLPYNANVGGQLKANLVHKHDKGNIKFFGKFLNDKVSSYEYIPINNFLDRSPVADFDLNTSTIYPDIEVSDLPDGEYFLADSTKTRQFDPSKGIITRNYAIGSSLSQTLGKGWMLKNNFKLSYADQDYSQYAGNIIFDPDGGLASFFQLPSFAFNDFTYTDFYSGEILYNDTIKNLDKIWAAAGFTIQNKILDVMDQVSVSKEFEHNTLSFGAYVSHADVDVEWTGDAIASTLETNPRPFLITHPNNQDPDNPFQFSDPSNGLIAQGSSSYNRAKGTSTTLSAFATDLFKITDKLNIDIGGRFETVLHRGQNELYLLATDTFGYEQVTVVPGVGLPLPIGVDQDYRTFYDSGTRLGTGEFKDYSFNYMFGSGSLGINYKFNEGLAIYGRGTIGNKAPELGYYISNFVNQPINKGFVEKIYMGEAGVKLRGRKGSVFFTGFLSRMNDVGFQLLVPGEAGIVVFTPSTFNKIQTLGSELEVVLYPVKGLNFRAMFTAQNPKFIEFYYYNLNGTANQNFIDPLTGELQDPNKPSDDFIEEFHGNNLVNVPKIITDATISYKFDRFKAYFNGRYTGKRPANRRNTLEMPGFAMFSGGLSCDLTKHISASFKVSNIFNSVGLMDFDGLGLLGKTKEDLTNEVISDNNAADAPNPYFIRPVLPRSMMLSLEYDF